MPRNTKTFAQITDFTRASVATYFDASGTLQTAASGVARTAAYRYNSTSAQWVLAGLLIEGQATNIAINNVAAGAIAGTPGTDPTGWQFNAIPGCTKQIVGSGTINGIDYVDVRMFGTATTTGGQGSSLTVGSAIAVNDVYNVSAYFQLIAGSFDNIAASFFQLRLSQGADSGPNFTISNVLTRVSATITATQTSGRASLRIAAANTTGPIDFTLRIGNPQMEKASFASSVIKTTTAQATRAADVLTKALGAEFNTSGQTVVLTVVIPNGGTIDDLIMWNWNNGGDNCRIFYRVSNKIIYGFMSFGGTGSANTGPVRQPGDVVKIAFGVSGKTTRLVVDGIAYADATNSATPVAFTTRRIGNSASGASQFNSFITEATEYLGLLSVAQMQALTT